MNVSKEKLQKIYKLKQEKKLINKTKAMCLEDNNGFLQIKINKEKKINGEKYFCNCNYNKKGKE